MQRLLLLVLAMLGLSTTGSIRACFRAYKKTSSTSRLFSVKNEPSSEVYSDFLSSAAKVETPQRLPTLLSMLTANGETLVDPKKREGLNPFLVPLSQSPVDSSLLCYIRWPTQREDMPLQLVRTTEAGVRLVSLSTDHLCHRMAIEMDFNNHAEASRSIDALNAHGQLYKKGDHLPFLNSGKFPVATEHDRKLVADRYLLTKVGPFADCYERLAENFMKQGNDVSALVTAERSVTVFYSWGHPMHFHSKALRQLGRDKECLESARASMGMPKWTLASTQADLEDAIKMAGFTGMSIVGDMHAFRATDPREKDIAEGHNPIQIILDQAAHLMDAVALGSFKGGWDAARPELAKRYRDSGYPDMAAFIET